MIDKEKMLNTISELFDSQDGSEEDIEQANLHYDQMLEELITMQNELSSSQQVTVTKKPKKKNNKKLQAILKGILYYHIPLYAVLFVLFFFGGNLLKDYVLQLPNVKQNTQYIVLVNLIPLGFMVCFALIMYLGIRGRYYFKVTGRSLSSDKGHYKRSYYELLEYFRGNNESEMNDDELSNESWKNAEGIILGKSKTGKLINVPSGKDGRNYMIFGLPGSGKTAGPIIVNFQ